MQLRNTDETGFIMIDGLDGMLWGINKLHVARFCFEEVRRCTSSELHAIEKYARNDRTAGTSLEVYLSTGETVTEEVASGDDLDRFAAEMPVRPGQRLAVRLVDGIRHFDADRIEYMQMPHWLLTKRFNRRRFKFLVAEGQRDRAA
jgi:hypothetical protein